MIINRGKFIHINKPEWFKDTNFLSCLKKEFIIIYWEENAGSLDNLPDYIANEIEQICKSECLTSCLIWITNLE